MHCACDTKAGQNSWQQRVEPVSATHKNRSRLPNRFGKGTSSLEQLIQNRIGRKQVVGKFVFNTSENAGRFRFDGRCDLAQTIRIVLLNLPQFRSGNQKVHWLIVLQLRRQSIWLRRIGNQNDVD